MTIEIIIIGIIVVTAFVAIVYYLGYQEDKRQRQYLQTQVNQLLAPEDKGSHLSEPTGTDFTVTQHRGSTCTCHNPEDVKTGPGAAETARELQL